LTRTVDPSTRPKPPRRPGATDASIVAVCERLNLDTVATLNRRDFDNLRPAHRPNLHLVPV
jgi:predicted nucleic acid-binding protein